MVKTRNNTNCSPTPTHLVKTFPRSFDSQHLQFQTSSKSLQRFIYNILMPPSTAAWMQQQTSHHENPCMYYKTHDSHSFFADRNSQFLTNQDYSTNILLSFFRGAIMLLDRKAYSSLYRLCVRCPSMSAVYSSNCE